MTDWKQTGEAGITEAQKRMLNAVSGDLARQIIWHGNRMDKDDWRHFLSGHALGWRMMPAFDNGQGAPGFIMLGGSSLKLSRTRAADAITMGLAIGDRPEEQGLKCKPVHWSDAVLLGLGHNPADFRAEAA